MGQCIIMTSGYAGDSSDDCTASKSQVLEGYTAITKDSDDEAVMGTMPNRGVGGHAVTSGINDKGLWYHISPGYYPASASDGGNCWIYRTQAEVAATAGLTANKLMKNQSVLGIAGTATSDANAAANHILSGKTAYVNGIKITGNLTIQSVVSFNVAQYSNLTIIASWANPSKGPWSGLRIVCKQGSYPSNVSDGTLFYEGSGTSATKSLAAGTWYFRSWNYVTTNTGRLYGGYHDKSINNQAIKGTQTFTSSAIFTVPASVRSIDIFCVGGGSGGEDSGSGGSLTRSGSGGGSGKTTTKKNIAVSPGSTLSISIGAGGIASSNVFKEINGGNTSVIINGTVICTAEGGKNYIDDKVSRYAGGNGGSGGGGCSYNSSDTSDNISGCYGGSDGSNGEGSRYASPTISLGQGTTTRAFGESSGTLYAGGGGSGGAGYSNGNIGVLGGTGGAGGGGNGGRGGAWNEAGTAGTFGTGSGGGGGGCKVRLSNKGGNGGSGICIIRWGY